MNDHDALWRAICENPREDTPRLVFADWLEENGQPERAAFIRTDIAMSLRDEWDADRLRWEAGLLSGALYTRLWSGTLFTPLPVNCSWGGRPATRRGFPWNLSTNLPDQVLSRHPTLLVGRAVDHLTFDGPLTKGEQLASLQGLETVTGLTFGRGAHSTRYLISLIESDCPNLVELAFWSAAATAASITALFSSLIPDRLTRLSLAGNSPNVGELAVEALLSSPPSRLRSLEVPASLRANDTEALVLGLPSTTRSLDLSSNRLNGELTSRIAGSPNLAPLRVLTFLSNPVGNAGAAALFTSPHLAGLKVLDLSYSMVGDEALRELLENSPLADGLNLLNLTGSPASADMKQAVKDRMGDRVRF